MYHISTLIWNYNWHFSVYYIYPNVPSALQVSTAFNSWGTQTVLTEGHT